MRYQNIRKQLNTPSARWALFILLNLLAVLIRLPLLHYQNFDFSHFLSPWMDFIRSHGHFAALKHGFSDYSPAYLYILSLLSYLPAQFDLPAIKLVSILFDWAGAFAIFKIVRLKFPSSDQPWWAYFLALFLPTVLFDSAYWGQCDAIYTSFLLWSFYFLLQAKPGSGMFFFGLAFAFKFQAVFLAPLLLLLLLRRKIQVTHALIPAGVYFLSVLPAWLLGRPIVNLLTIYVSQSQNYHQLSLNAPNLYQFMPGLNYNLGLWGGLVLSALAVIAYLWVGLTQRNVDRPDWMLLSALLSLVLVPWVLPKMHERYFFAACLFALPLAFYIPRLRLLPLCLQTATLIAFLPFLRGIEYIPLELAALLMSGVVVWLWVHYVEQKQSTTSISKTPVLQEPGSD